MKNGSTTASLASLATLVGSLALAACDAPPTTPVQLSVGLRSTARQTPLVRLALTVTQPSQTREAFAEPPEAQIDSGSVAWSLTVDGLVGDEPADFVVLLLQATTELLRLERRNVNLAALAGPLTLGESDVVEGSEPDRDGDGTSDLSELLHDGDPNNANDFPAPRLIAINTPTNGAVFCPGDSVVLTATATTLSGGDFPPASLRWTSGAFSGSVFGSSVTRSLDSPGQDMPIVLQPVGLGGANLGSSVAVNVDVLPGIGRGAACVPTDTCCGDLTCAAGFCDDPSCGQASDSCTGDTDCCSGLVCDGVTCVACGDEDDGRCGAACVDCAAGNAVCNGGACACPSTASFCQIDSACTPTLTGNTCGATCTDCAASGQTCTAGNCTTVCTPQTCQSAGYTCGEPGDGCGSPLNCGNCSGPQTCAPTFQCCTDGDTDGYYAEGCGGPADCSDGNDRIRPGGTCGDGYLACGGVEACDDTNNMSGDGCSADCTAIEAGAECPTPGQACCRGPGSACDVGSDCCNNNCNTVCQP